jgi:Uma2 family endonuclease
MSIADHPHENIGDNATSRLDEDNEPQPDAMLLLPSWAGSSARFEDGYVCGAPDLACEVTASSVSIDLHAKKNAYRRNGVKEYLAWRVEEAAVDWFALVEGRYELMPADEQGRIPSRIFPGLWLDVAALLAGDLPKLFTAVDEGTATDAHRAFVERLKAAAPR